jgi:serine/threonine protein kinase/tetratricopeptide (TPR) repeat protein
MSEGSPPSDHGQATLARGASIGRYVVLGLVGRGGMGEVYAAYDPELDRKVAVKLLRVKPGAGVSLTEGRQRTLREAQAIARLSHPNVVVVYDVGTFEEKVFIAMEFVEGHTAGFWSQSQTRTWEEALKVYQAAGRGLAAAHEKGLVHRDFKPDNIMVSRDGQVRVMDFGLARQAEKPVTVTGEKAIVTGDGVTTTQRLPAPLAEPGAPLREPGAPIAPLDGSTLVLTPNAGDDGTSEFESSKTAAFDQRLTRTGAMMGTPAYMAPEQFRGRATDARCDQFAFCVALYEALYGERPFGGNTLMALTTNVVNGRVREAPANTKVPLWIRKILLRGLRVNADERFPSMVELLEALGRDPAVARRRWILATSGAVLLLAAGTGFGMRQGMAESKPVCRGGPEKLDGIWEVVPAGSGETPRQAQLHEAFLKTGKSYAKDVWATTSRALTSYARAWTDMYRETCEATAVHKVQSTEVLDLRMDCLNERLGGLRALTDVFSDATGEVVENAVSASNALAPLDRCADVPLLRAVVRPPEDAETRARVDALRKNLAALRAKFDAGFFRQTVEQAPELVATARKIGYRPLVAETLALLGTAAAKTEEAGTAREALQEAFVVSEASRHDEVRADVAAVLVYVVGYEEGQFDEAYRWAGIADAILQRLGGHDLLRAWSLNDVGAVYFRQGRREAAIRVFKESLALKEKVLGHQHPDVGVSEGNLAISLAEMGRHDEALSHIERAIKIVEAGLGTAHPDLAIQLNNHGEILNALHRYADARRVFERAQQIWERELGSENRGLADSLTGVGLSYLGARDATDAVAFLERARDIRAAKESNLAKRAEASFALARALWASSRDRDRARQLADEARTVYARAGEKLKSSEVEQWLKDPRSI